MANDPKVKYDLEERTSKYAEEIIKFSKKIPLNLTTKPIISQLVRAGTSIGANYCEADDAESKKILFISWVFVRKKREKPNIG